MADHHEPWRALTGPTLEYGSGTSYTLKQRLLLATVPFAAASVLKLIFRSARVHESGREHFETLMDRGHVLVGAWHESLSLLACQFSGQSFHTLASLSFDGELAARAIEQFGGRCLRGSSSRGGVKALAQLELATQTERLVGLTLDGPRGPRHVAKPGLAFLSSRTKLPVIVVAAHAEPAWRLRSWDRFQIAKPFSRIRFAYSEPIAAPDSASDDSVEAMRARMESTLRELHDGLERDAD